MLATVLTDNDYTWDSNEICLFVGNVRLSGGSVNESEAIGYYTKSNEGNWEKYTGNDTPSAPYFQYHGDGELTLNGVEIEEEEENQNIGGVNVNAGIFAYSGSNAIELTINLEGTNTVSGSSQGIYVKTMTGDAMLEIKGSGGSATLEATSTSSVGSAGICVSSENGSASLNISGGTDVTARNTAHYWGGYGVYLNSWGDNPIPPTNLTVDGGSLTASGATNGIYSQYNGGNSSDNGTLNLTVSNNAVVRAENGIGKNGNNSSVNYQTDGANGGIVFDGGNGTVYGNVTLQDDLTIGEGESLTVPEGSRLNTNGKLTVNGGTLTGIERITGTVKYAPTITTTSLTEGTVGTAYSQILAAMGDMPITWSVSGGSLPGGLSLSSDGKITGTPTDAGEFSFTVTADNNSGSDSKEFSLSVGQATPQATDFTFTAPTDLVYDGNAKYATVTAKEGIVGMGEITVIEYYDEDGNLLTDAPVNAGVYTVKIDAAKGDNYTAVTDLTDNTWKFTIEQSGTVFENDEITTNKSSYTYGDTMTVTVKPVPTGVEASRMLSFDAPTTNQMAIFFDDKQVSDGADAETDGTYTMTVYTTDIGAGTKELTAKYVGNSNMADYEKKFNVHINKATPQVSDFTFTAPTDLVYDGNGKTSTVTANAGIGTVTVVYYKADGTRLNIAPVDAGAYTVKIDAAEGDNYTAVTDLTDNTWTFEIKQATPVLAENSIWKQSVCVVVKSFPPLKLTEL